MYLTFATAGSVRQPISDYEALALIRPSLSRELASSSGILLPSFSRQLLRTDLIRAVRASVLAYGEQSAILSNSFRSQQSWLARRPNGNLWFIAGFFCDAICDYDGPTPRSTIAYVQCRYWEYGEQHELFCWARWCQPWLIHPQYSAMFSEVHVWKPPRAPAVSSFVQASWGGRKGIVIYIQYPSLIAMLMISWRSEKLDGCDLEGRFSVGLPLKVWKGINAALQNKSCLVYEKWKRSINYALTKGFVV